MKSTRNEFADCLVALLGIEDWHHRQVVGPQLCKLNREALALLGIYITRALGVKLIKDFER